MTTETRTLDLLGRDAYVGGSPYCSRVTRVDGDQVFTTISPTESTGAAEVVTLPLLGEAVKILLGGGAVEGTWLGSLPHPFVPGEAVRMVALVLCGARASQFVVRPEQVEARQTVRAPAPEGDQSALLALRIAALDLVDARAAHEVTRKEHAQQMDQLVTAAHEYADENSLCERFDEFMEAHDLPGRVREHEVEVDVTARVVVTVTARSAQEAAGDVTSYAVMERLDRNTIDWTVVEDED